MSLELSRQVNAEHPELLRTNIGSTCHQFTLDLIEKLKANGHQAYLMCKTAGEGQYVPPGFQPRPVEGLDGKTYTCTGVSHDAIWCDGAQFDTIASANDNDQPIYEKKTDPFWSFNPADGKQIVGSPVWNAVPPEHWRANNPPLETGAPAPIPPQPQPPSGQHPIPPRDEALDEMDWLDAYYAAPEGLQRPGGLSINGDPDFEGIAAWYLDVYQNERMKGKTREQAREAYVNQIRHSAEWQAKHPGETP